MMTENSFYETNTENSVIALGFFDAVHIGHKKVISDCIALSEKLNAKSMVFTFNDNPATYFGRGSKLICTYEERIKKIQDIGVDKIVFAPCDKNFFNMAPMDFLSHLKNNLSVIGIVCGKDYSFGKFGRGDAEMLSVFCDKNGIECIVVDEVLSLGERISSRNIRSLLEQGNINDANYLLGYRYTLGGTVVKGRGDGKKSVFPTININFPNEKVIPKEGVYATKVLLDNKVYSCVTNIGSHPTFEDYSKNVETHIIDFDGELYGQVINVEFVERLRDIIKFDCIDSLKKQISTDILKARML